MVWRYSDPMKLEKNLFYYPWENPLENNCNSYVIRGCVTVLIDVGHLKHLGRLLASMRKDGLSPQDLDLIMSTHCHPDHFEALSQFAESKAVMAMHQEEERYLKDQGETLYQMMGITSPRSRADFYLREGTLKLGKIDLRVYHTPGHSPGSLCFYWPQKKVLISGDVVFHAGVGRTDFPGGDSNQLKLSIQRLSQLDIEVLLPGHGEIVTGKQSVRRNFNLIRDTYFPIL
jgi:glyoxylase-like metal-dependent hydrolase (beta-lactamase superfamily II)